MNFTTPRHTLLFLYSEIYIVHVTNCEWSRSVNFLLHMFCMWYKNVFFFNNWYQCSLQFRFCITCFVSFGIKDGNFMMLEDSTLNFLHGYWNYCLMKIDIDVMMLFKFDFKYIKLNFKAIESMEFSYDLNLFLMWSRNYVLFKWNVKNGSQKNLKKFSFTSFNQSRITFDWLKVPFDLSSSDRVNLRLYEDFFNFSIDQEFLFFNQIGIGYRSSHPKTWKFFDEDFDWSRNRFDRLKWTVFEISLSIKT